MNLTLEWKLWRDGRTFETRRCIEGRLAAERAADDREWWEERALFLAGWGRGHEATAADLRAVAERLERR